MFVGPFNYLLNFICMYKMYNNGAGFDSTHVNACVHDLTAKKKKRRLTGRE